MRRACKCERSSKSNDASGRGLPQEEFKSILKDLEHASQKDSHGVSANVLDEDVLEQICWTYADPDEKDLVSTTILWMLWC